VPQFTIDTVRLFLHILGAAVWVGGQIVVGGIVPALRGVSPEAPKTAARAFARIAWPAYALVVVTGIWNMLEVGLGDVESSYNAVLGIKILLVALSGVAAFLHTRAKTPAQRGMWGSIAGLTALVALFLGEVLRP
jgi:putative copper export protein